MFFLSSAAAAVFPMLIYLFFIWKYDRYDREPFSHVLRNYLWGAVGAVIFAILGSDLLYSAVSLFISNKELLNNIQIIIIAPLVEEFTKGIFLLVTIASRKFDNLTDGIVYGGAIGLGFGMTENFLYFITYGDTLQNWVILVIIRTLFSAVMHGVCTATLGAFLGYAKFRDMGFKLIAAVVGLFTAIIIHVLWNFFISFESTAALGFIFIGASAVMMFVIFSLSVAAEKNIIFHELSEEVAAGIIPAEHLLILNSSRRNKLGWIDENVRRFYIKAATTLAFRKMQFRYTNGRNKILYQQEIEYYRTYIQSILAGTI